VFHDHGPAGFGSYISQVFDCERRADATWTARRN